MYEEYRLRELRRVYSRQGWVLLAYYAILNVSVMLVVLVDAVYQGIMSALAGLEIDPQQLTDTVQADSGWGYFLAIGIGLLMLFLWKKPRFFIQKIWLPGKPMRLGSFFAVSNAFSYSPFFQ